VRLGVFVAAGLVLAVALAFLVAPWASGEPDGLERVAIDEGFAETATDHPLGDSPTADYGVEGVDDDRLGTGLAGALGIAVTFALAFGALALVRRAGGGRAADGPNGSEDAERSDDQAPSEASEGSDARR
jgi:hypothetical protein